MFGQLEQIENEMRRMLNPPTDIASQLKGEAKRRLGLETIHKQPDLVGLVGGSLKAALAAEEIRKDMLRMIGHGRNFERPAEIFDFTKWMRESGERFRLEMEERGRQRREELEKSLEEIRRAAARQQPAPIVIVINLHGQQPTQNAQNDYSN